MIRHSTRLVLVSAMCALILVSACRPGPWYRLVDTWDRDANGVKMRLRKFADRSTFQSQCYFVIDAGISGSSTWKEILTWYDEGCSLMQRERIQFVGRRVVYAFDYSSYAVTTDAGGHWSVWDVSSTASELRANHTIYLTQIDVSQDGTGKMVLTYYTDVPGIFHAQYRTSDYGLHWARQACDPAWPATMPCRQ